MVISLILWALSSFGPSKRIDRLNKEYKQLKSQPMANISQLDKNLHSTRLENSYAGILGKAIEPVIVPLGYDWKIGIALSLRLLQEKFLLARWQPFIVLARTIRIVSSFRTK